MNPQLLTSLDYHRTVFVNHRGKMALYFLTVMSAVVSVTLLTRPEYRSESKVFVRLGRENTSMDPTATMGQGSVNAMPSSREEEINSMVEMFHNKALIGRLVDEFGPTAILDGQVRSDRHVAGASASLSGPAEGTEVLPTRDELEQARLEWESGSSGRTMLRMAGIGIPIATGGASTALAALGRIRLFDPVSPRERAVTQMATRLSVWAAKKSNVITIEYEAYTPELARALVSRVVDVYLEEHLKMSRAAGSRDFFVTQTEEVKSRLVEGEKELRDLKDSTGLASVEDQRKIMVDRIGSLEDEALATQRALAEARSEAAALTEQLRDIPQMMVTERATGNAADSMRQQLYLLQLKEQELLSKYTDNVTVVQEVRRQIREATDLLTREESKRTQEKSGRNPAFEQLNLALLTKQSLVASLEAKAQSITRQLGASRLALNTLNDNEMKVTRLKRDLDLQDASYRKYAASLEQVNIDHQLELQRISNVSIVQPATLEEKPVRPRKLLNVGVGLLVAVFGAIGLAHIAEQFNRSTAN